MGQTISLGACISGGSVVKVMNTDGVFECYLFPSVTAEVMLKHPGHIVVHCPSQGNSSRITIMLPDQPLLPGEPYMLYPIPEKHKEYLARTKSFSLLRRQMEWTEGEEITAAAEKKKGRRSALKIMVTRLSLATHLASKLSHKAQQDEHHSQPLLEDAEEKEKRKAPQPLDMPCHHWKPALSSIPESPLGFHSIPQTPVGLYKIPDLYQPQPFPGTYQAAVH